MNLWVISGTSLYYLHTQRTEQLICISVFVAMFLLLGSCQGYGYKLSIIVSELCVVYYVKQGYYQYNETKNEGEKNV